MDLADGREFYAWTEWRIERERHAVPSREGSNMTDMLLHQCIQSPYLLTLNSNILTPAMVVIPILILFVLKHVCMRFSFTVTFSF